MGFSKLSDPIFLKKMIIFRVKSRQNIRRENFQIFTIRMIMISTIKNKMDLCIFGFPKKRFFEIFVQKKSSPKPRRRELFNRKMERLRALAGAWICTANVTLSCHRLQGSMWRCSGSAQPVNSYPDGLSERMIGSETTSKTDQNSLRSESTRNNEFELLEFEKANPKLSESLRQETTRKIVSRPIDALQQWIHVAEVREGFAVCHNEALRSEKSVLSSKLCK